MDRDSGKCTTVLIYLTFVSSETQNEKRMCVVWHTDLKGRNKTLPVHRWCDCLCRQSQGMPQKFPRINDFSKWFKASPQKATIFQYTRDKQLKTEFFFPFFFLKRGKYQRVVVPSVPLQGTCPTTQACALTGNQTSDISVCRPALSPLSHTSQGWKLNLKNLQKCPQNEIFS